MNETKRWILDMYETGKGKAYSTCSSLSLHTLVSCGVEILIDAVISCTVLPLTALKMENGTLVECYNNNFVSFRFFLLRWC